MIGADRAGGRRLGWLLVLGAIALALAINLHVLGSVPPGLHYDEAFDGLDAYGLLQTPLQRWPIFFNGNFGREPLFMYLLALSQAVASPGAVALRIVPALCASLLTPALIWLGWEIGPSLAVAPAHRLRFVLWAGIAPLAALWHLIFARYAIRIELLALALTLVMAALLRAWRTRRARWWMLGGALVGLSLYTYLPARLLPLVFAPPFLALLARNRPGLRDRRRGLLVALAAAGLVALPLLLYFARNPLAFNTRAAQVSILEPGRLGLLPSNALKVFAMPWIGGDANWRSNLPGRPVFDLMAGAFLLAGLLALVRRILRPGPLLVLSWLGVMLLPSILSEHAPSFQRAIGALPPLCLALALGIESVVALLERWRPSARGAWAGLATAALAASVALAVAALWRWSLSPDLFYARDVGFAALGRALSAERTAHPVYLSPRGAEHPTIRYLTLGVPALQLRGFDGLSCVRVAEEGPARYIFLPGEETRGQAVVARYLPGAPQQVAAAGPSGEPWAVAVQQPAGMAPVFPEMTPRPAAGADGIALLGYWLSNPAPQPGDRLYVRLFWQAGATPARDYTAFVQLVAPAGDGWQRLAGSDRPPGNGSCPTSSWQAGEIVVDELELVFPEAAAAVDGLALGVGLYDPATGIRLPLEGRADGWILIPLAPRDGGS